jgi:phage I-like protein
VLLAEPPATGLIRIPIAITGSWKGAEKEFGIELEDLNDIRENLAKKPTGEINVDYEHASEVPFGTGSPVLSAGRIIKLDVPEAFNGTGKHILWGWYEPTDRARELIKNKEYRYVSPAIRWGAKDKVTGKTQGTTLTSLALVNKPFLEELPQIQASETVDGQKVFVSLGQLHVPGPVNQVSVAYEQSRSQEVEQSSRQAVGSGGDLNSSTPRLLDSSTKNSREDKSMLKQLKFKTLTDAHLEKHSLPASHKGKIGVFDGDELLGVSDDGPDGWVQKGDDDEEKAKACELFASEVGMAGKALPDISAMVKIGQKHIASPISLFEMIEAHLNSQDKIVMSELDAMVDSGKVRYSAVRRAEEAERKVTAAIKAGKVLGKNRRAALKLALSDAAAFDLFVNEAKPVVDLKTYGHADGGEQTTAQQAFLAEVNAYAKENKVSIRDATQAVITSKPRLWEEHSMEVVANVAPQAAEEE